MNLMEAFIKIGLDTSEVESGLGGLRSGLGAAASAGAAAIGAAAGAAVDFAKSAVDVGKNFDASMSNVAAISGATGGEFDALRDKAREMGANTKFSASEAADAMSYMAMAGWKTGDMLDGIDGLMMLAAASGEDLATTSDIVTDALTAFGQGADQAGRLADIMAAASSNANTNVYLMGETFKYVAPLAGSLGYDMEDTAVAIGLMANAGIKGSQGGTALRSILTRLAKPTKDSETAMNALGISLEDSKGNMYTLMEVMEQMRDAFHDKLMIPEEEFQSSLAELNQKLEDGEIKQKDYNAEVEALTERAYGAEGAVMAQYAAMLGGQEAMSGLLAIVNASEEDFSKLANAVTNSTGAAEEMSGVMQDNLAGDMEIFNSAVQEAQITVSDRLTPTIREFVQLATKGVSEVASAFNSGGMESAMSAFGTWLSDAIAMVVEKLPEAVSAGAQLLGALVGGLVDNIPQMARAAVEIVGGLASGLMEALPKFAESAVGIMASFGEYLRENLPTMIKSGLEMVKSLSGSLRENAGLIVDGAIALALSLAQGLIDSLPDIIRNVPEIVSNIAGIINDNAPKILMAGIQLVGALVVGIIQAIPTIVQELPKIVGAICDVIMAFNWINLGSSIVSAIKDGIGGMFGSIKDTAVELLKRFKDPLQSAPEVLKNIGKELINGLIQGALNLIGEIPNHVAKIVASVIGAFRSLFGIHSPATVMIEIGGYLMSGLAKGLVDGAVSAINSAKKVASDVLNAIKGFFGIHSPSSVMDKEVGQMLGEGEIRGMRKKFPAIRNAAAEMKDLMVDRKDQWGDVRTVSSNTASEYGMVQVIPVNRGQDAGRNLTVILEMDRQQLGRAVYRLNNEETQRVGLRLAGGFA